LTAPADRRQALENLDAAVAAGARAHKVAELLVVGFTTLQRWRRQFADVGDGLDRRKGSHHLVSHRLSDEERQRILFTCNEPESRHCRRGRSCQSWPNGGCISAQSAASTEFSMPTTKCIRRGRARQPQQPRPVPRLEARGPNEVWSWDITFLPTSVRGVWLYLYLVIDVWSRKVVAWDGADRVEAQIAADLVGRACLRERISKGRRQPLILHADNGNAMRAATLESRMEELGVLRSFSRPRVNNDNPYSESLFHTLKYQPDYPRRPFQSMEEACSWVAAFVGWYNDQHRHSGIRFVTPSQRHSGKAIEICRHRARVYELARQLHPLRWTGTTRCWHQPEVVWINPPPPEIGINRAKLVVAA
jgi:transposase InsO family protein